LETRAARSLGPSGVHGSTSGERRLRPARADRAASARLPSRACDSHSRAHRERKRRMMSLENPRWPWSPRAQGAAVTTPGARLAGERSLEPVLALSDPIGVSAQPSGAWRGGIGGGQLLQPKPFSSIWRHINSWSVSVPPRICLSLIASIRLAVPAASKSDSYAGIATVPRLDRPERTSSGDPRRSSQERRTSAALQPEC
jgi:hypothetical protein